MNKDFSSTDASIAEYAYETFKPMDTALSEVRARAEKNEIRAIHVGEMDGLHLEVLTLAFNAKKVVEIGTLAGYSGLCILRALQEDGKLFTFEYERKHAEVSRETFQKNGFAEKAEIFIGPAAENLRKIESQGPFDLVFIDADKVNYPVYLAWAIENLRIGGAVLGDNTFAWGMIADEKAATEGPVAADVSALRMFNHICATSPRLRATVLPTGEGLTLAVKIR